MTSMRGQVNGAGEQTARQAAHKTKWLARIGLASYGIVHLLVAWLAIQVAMGDDSKADKTGALKTVAANPAGALLLWVITIGLSAFVLWQLVEAIWGHETAGEHRTRKRLVNLGEALLFGYLAYTAGRIAASGSAPGDSDQASLVAKLLAEPYGKALVAIGGLAVVAVALFVVRHGFRKRFVEELDLAGATPATQRTVIRLGQVGYMAIGAVYGIAGILVVVAAVRSDPSKATGLDTALKTLAAQPYGVVLLVIVALGLAAFGVYCLFDARYRRA